EFGIDVTNLWLPDVFGYSAALPQILKKAGVDIFMTQKLSWNQVNKLPHHSFQWEGIDGSTILAHMLPEDTYASQALPNSAKKAEENYKDKAESEHCLMLYGIGDGGGGPGAEHLERLKRLKNMAGLCPVVQESAADFFKKWRQDADKFPRWTGELYFERHQGTLTNQARNKWYNRKMELGLRELEWSAVIAKLTTGQNYPTDALTKFWEDVLLLQFHDILPGSSIKRVYDESLAEYEIMFQQVNAALNANDETLAPQIDTSQAKKPAIVRNSLSWPRSEWIKIEDTWQQVTVPAMGYAVVDLSDECVVPKVNATETLLENEKLKVTFAADGSISSIRDKSGKREVLDGKPANQFEVYPDLWDAWDFQMDYRDYPTQQMQLQSAKAWIDGPQAVVEQHYQLNQSTLTQQIILTAGSNRLDFVTTVNWQEANTMLRTSFPVAVHSDQARYEIQYGNLLRPTHANTTWDLARDEVVGHKWVDLSETSFGVALLNDSKYGHRIKGNVIDLNLLRSMPYPEIGDLINESPPEKESQKFGDQCEHHFAYALLPHSGDYLAGNVIQQAYQLNIPLRIHKTEVQSGNLPAAKSWLELDNPNVIIESVKKAEDSDAIIVRIYEAAHSTVDVTLTLGMPVSTAEEVNLMEESIQLLTISNNQLALHLTPFEITTIKLNLQ
ncbi:alpha-mannosidase, partial [bacterium]|nr:alpha-mannosidase [bacterium]